MTSPKRIPRSARHLSLPPGAWDVDACVPMLLAAEARRPTAFNGKPLWIDAPRNPEVVTGAVLQLRHAVLVAHKDGLRADALSQPIPKAALRILRRLARFMEREHASAELAGLAELLRQRRSTIALDVERLSVAGSIAEHALSVIAGESSRASGHPPDPYRRAFVNALANRWEEITGVCPCIAPKASNRPATIGALFHEVLAAGLRDVGRPNARCVGHFVRMRKPPKKLKK